MLLADKGRSKEANIMELEIRCLNEDKLTRAGVNIDVTVKGRQVLNRILKRSVYDTLQSFANLQQWGLYEDPNCKVCGKRGIILCIFYQDD